MLERGSLGNAMDLIEKSFERFLEKKELIDFNLDGDRGYSYLCWTQVQKGAADAPDYPGELNVNVPGGDPSDDTINVDLRFIK